jgi:hypothetical protein
LRKITPRVSQNSFVGSLSGSDNSTGSGNSFFGYYAGHSNTVEDNNTFLGAYANGSAGITNATALGYRANVTQSNSLVLGSINSINDADASTKVGIGITNPERRFHVAETGTTATRGVAFDQYSADQFASVFILRKSRNATPGAHTILQNGDALFNFTGQGSDGTKFVDVARIRMEIDAVPGVSNMPGRMTFWTTPNGSAATAERMRIDSLGNVGIGTTAPTERLTVAGNIRATGSIFTQPGPETEIPDYVFKPEYRLRPIEELQQYLATEGHLPNIPSAEEIKGKGLDLSTFQLKLLEKIEELTLYTVRQAGTIRELEAAKKSEVASLEAKNIALEIRLAEVEQALRKLARPGEK